MWTHPKFATVTPPTTDKPRSNMVTPSAPTYAPRAAFSWVWVMSPPLATVRPPLMVIPVVGSCTRKPSLRVRPAGEGAAWGRGGGEMGRRRGGAICVGRDEGADRQGKGREARGAGQGHNRRRKEAGVRQKRATALPFE